MSKKAYNDRAWNKFKELLSKLVATVSGFSKRIDSMQSDLDSVNNKVEKIGFYITGPTPDNDDFDTWSKYDIATKYIASSDVTSKGYPAHGHLLSIATGSQISQIIISRTSTPIYKRFGENGSFGSWTQS